MLVSGIGVVAPIIVILTGVTTKSLKYMSISNDLTIAVLVYTVAGWTIYGYTLAGSSDNDCAALEEQDKSMGWNTALIIDLVLGSLTICYAIALVYLLPIQIKEASNR